MSLNLGLGTMGLKPQLPAKSNDLAFLSITRTEACKSDSCLACNQGMRATHADSVVWVTGFRHHLKC